MPGAPACCPVNAFPPPTLLLQHAGTKDADKKDSEEDGDTLFSFVFPGLIDINVPRPDLGINTMLKLAPGGGALAIRRPCRDEPKTLKISQDV